MTDLITGASGFLGRRLAEILRARGENPRLLLRPSSTLGALDPGPGAVVRAAFEDVEALTRVLDGIRRIYHCAGLSSDWGRWADFRAANITAVENLLAAALRVGSVERFIHVSTTDVYGYPVMPCDESHAVRDAGLPYNRSKGEGDRLSLAFSRRTGLPVTIVRPATIFGPRSKDWVVELSRLLVKGHALTLGGGHTPAGLVYVDDVATAMIALADLPAAAGEAYNVVDPSPVTWRAYFDRIADALGVARPQRDLGPRAAMMLAHLCEGAYRCAGIGTRPLFTRHVVLLMSRSQQYDSRKLRQALPDFPAIGVSRGLELTADWLASAEGARSWRNDARS